MKILNILWIYHTKVKIGSSFDRARVALALKHLHTVLLVSGSSPPGDGNFMFNKMSPVVKIVGVNLTCTETHFIAQSLFIIKL